jgi:hypothetical protein
MKYIKTYETIFEQPSADELKDYNIEKNDYVIANDYYNGFGLYFIDDLIMNHVGKVCSIFISNKGYRNEQIYCDVLYENIPNHISKHISGNPSSFHDSVPINQLRKLTTEELEQHNLNQSINKYNL